MPNALRELVASPSALFCDKWFNLQRLPKLLADLFSYFVGDDGKLTVEGAAFVCQLNCGGTGSTTPPGGGNPSNLAAPVINATDGVYLDKVVITWAAVAGATSYDVYRNTIDNNATALLIGNVTGTSFDDTTAVAGTSYYYWTKAKDAAGASAFSNANTGFVAQALDAIMDLDATKGFSSSIGGGSATVRLVWTPLAIDEVYDIYRRDFGTSDWTKIDSDRLPYDNSVTLGLGPTPYFVDNGGEVVYYDTPPNRFAKYDYKVLVRRPTIGGISPDSNVATGWAVGDGSGGIVLGNSTIIGSGVTENVPSGVVRAYIVLFGSGGGGAGGGTIYGGGGGGGGAVAYGSYNIQTNPNSALQSKIKVVSIPEAATARAQGFSDGAAGASTAFQYSADGTSFSSLLIASPPGGGDYNTAGGGMGGIGGTGVASAAGLTNNGTKIGRPGGNAVGARGGRSGTYFGSTRRPPAHFLRTDLTSHNGDGSDATAGNPAGSGSYADPAGQGSVVEGGKGGRGYAFVTYYAS